MNSLRTRLFTWIGFCLLGMFAVSGLLLYVYVDHALEAHFDAVLLERINILARTTEQYPDGSLEFEFLEAELAQYQARENADYYQVWRRTGETVERSLSLESYNLPVEFPLQQTPIFKNITLPDGRSGRLVIVNFVPHQDSIELEKSSLLRLVGVTAVPHQQETLSAETFIMALGISREELDTTLSRVFQGLCLAGLALVLGAFPGIWLAVRHALENLDTLAWQTSTIEADNLSFRFPTEDVPLELHPISSRLNNLLERLEAAFDRERRFTADAAHELRTPIAELKTLSEVGLEEAANKAPDMRPYFEDALAVANHMESLVTLLLTLSRCESGLQKVNTVSTELVRVVREEWAGHEEDAREHEHRVTIEVSDDVFIETDEDLLKAILANIFSNAVAYTPAGGNIRITLDVANDTTNLTVINTNTDLTESDVAHLFDPFWRKNQERSNTAHCGIGLSLVAAYARLLDITITASIPTVGFLQVLLTFPSKL